MHHIRLNTERGHPRRCPLITNLKVFRSGLADSMASRAGIVGIIAVIRRCGIHSGNMAHAAHTRISGQISLRMGSNSHGKA